MVGNEGALKIWKKRIMDSLPESITKGFVEQLRLNRICLAGEKELVRTKLSNLITAFREKRLDLQRHLTPPVNHKAWLHITKSSQSNFTDSPVRSF